MCSAFPENTPTGVGKTGIANLARLVTKKHPHGRGENRPQFSSVCRQRETPPRAWGRPSNSPLTKHPQKKHPHGRGEDFSFHSAVLSTHETPPRAWGRHLHNISVSARAGNTPTGVGKTTKRQAFPLVSWKHPHGRGEDIKPRAYTLQ